VTQATRVLAELPSEPVYAILDGARDPRIRNWVMDTRAASWCLYRGALPASLENAAPWLLRLARGQPYTEEFFERGWNHQWGVIFTSSAASRELRRHLRRFLLVRTEDKRRLLFRYYDPRVLRVYLPTCTPEEVAHFLGPISAFAAAAERPDRFEVYSRDGKGLVQRQIAMKSKGPLAPRRESPMP
jgi:hypothetical protein